MDGAIADAGRTGRDVGGHAMSIKYYLNLFIVRNKMVIYYLLLDFISIAALVYLCVMVTYWIVFFRLPIC